MRRSKRLLPALILYAGSAARRALPVKRSSTWIAEIQRSRYRRMVSNLLALSLLLLHPAASQARDYDLRGHLKPQASLVNLPADSRLQDFSDDPMRDIGLDLRANLSGNEAAWSWRGDYQLLAQQGDQIELAQDYPLAGFQSTRLVDDERRLFDLTHRLVDDDDRVVLHRLDRLYLGHTTDRSVFKIGRQAISWGNGLIYNPVDFFNPFDPAAIDTEYKTGDDMAYAQYLLDSGDDLQAVWVARRDADGDVSSEVASLAFKYHLFSGEREMDLLIAEHYDQQIAALGGSVDIADAIWRGDLMVTSTDDDSVVSAVLSWSYSLLAWRRNMSTTLEYFHSGFGIDDGHYDPAALAANPELLARLGRGELFTLAQNYLAGAATIELTPLWLLTTSLFRNLDDDSMLLQLLSHHDLQQDLQLLLALNLPTGEDGSEFGGIDSEIAGKPVAVGASAFAQLAWYF
jgi:hypothetical protein